MSSYEEEKAVTAVLTSSSRKVWESFSGGEKDFKQLFRPRPLLES